VAAALTTVALIYRWALDPIVGGIQPFAFFYLSALVTAWWVGAGPGMLAAVAGLVIGLVYCGVTGHTPTLGTVLVAVTYTAVSACLLGFVRQTRASEGAARDSERRFRRAFAEAPIGMVLAHLDGRLRYVNRAYCELTGYSERELLAADGMSFTHLTHPDDLPQNRISYDRLLAGEIPAFFLEKRYVRKDGRVVWVRVSASLHHDNDGHPLHVVGLIEDIDVRLRAEESARRANTLLGAISDSSRDAIFATDDQGRLTFVNPAAATLTGRPAAEVLGKRYEDFLDPECARVIEANDRRVIESGAPLDVEEVVPNPDGEPSVWLARKMPWRDADGRVIGVLGISRDVTEAKATEAILRESEARHRELAARLDAERAKLSAVIENLPVGVGMGDADGGTISLNKAGLALHGFSSEAEIHASLEAYVAEFELLRVDGGPLPVNEWPAARAVRGDFVRNLEVRVRNRRAGTERTVSYGVAPVFGPGGRPTVFVYLMHDLTEQKRTELALARAKDQLAAHAAHLERTVAERTAELTQSIRELEAFSYSLSHDMRAPLRAMTGFAQIVLTEHGDRIGPQGSLYLGKISRAAARLDQLIRDVLTYSRVVRERIELGPVDVEKLAYQLIDENPALQPPQADVRILSPLAPVCAHEAYLMQALSNLVYNAVKFVVPGEQPQVVLWTEREGEHVRICVRDNGIGVAPDARERIFGMFERLHAGDVYEGTGIGLTIVRKAVERMRGHVGVESELGVGSTFWIRLHAPAATEQRGVEASPA
jgi:PAS domain S-box-containing protein